MPSSHREYLYLGEKTVTVPIPQDRYMQERLKKKDPVFNQILSACSTPENMFLSGAIEERELEVEIARLGIYGKEDLGHFHNRLEYYKTIREIEMKTGFTTICEYKE
jgi:hypothetical protein